MIARSALSLGTAFLLSAIAPPYGALHLRSEFRVSGITAPPYGASHLRSEFRRSASTIAAQSVAATQASAPVKMPTPCADAPERHRFDFWLGEWDVTTPAGGHAGSSSVQSVSGGCALLESWTSVNGGHGNSLNAFNPATGQWQQYWIGQDGNPTEFRESTWSGNSIVFRAHVPAVGQAPATETRLTFTPSDSSTVRQHGESSTDGGATWHTTYLFVYHRKR